MSYWLFNIRKVLKRFGAAGAERILKKRKAVIKYHSFLCGFRGLTLRQARKNEFLSNRDKKVEWYPCNMMCNNGPDGHYIPEEEFIDILLGKMVKM